MVFCLTSSSAYVWFPSRDDFPERHGISLLPCLRSGLCYLRHPCFIVSASSTSSNLLPPLFLLHRQFSLVLTSTSFVFPASLTLLPLLPPLSLLPRLCSLASASSPPLPLTLLPLPLPLSLLVAARERPWPPARAEVLAKASERACVILLGDVEVH